VGACLLGPATMAGRLTCGGDDALLSGEVAWGWTGTAKASGEISGDFSGLGDPAPSVVSGDRESLESVEVECAPSWATGFTFGGGRRTWRWPVSRKEEYRVSLKAIR
jgi:hypothetical protein